MATGDPKVPKASPAPQTSARTGSRTSGGGRAAGRSGNGRAGTSRSTRASTTDPAPQVEADDGDDLLARLAQLEELPAAPAGADEVVLPAIVEADPTYPPVERDERPTSHRVDDGDGGEATAALPTTVVETTAVTSAVPVVAPGEPAPTEPVGRVVDDELAATALVPVVDPQPLDHLGDDGFDPVPAMVPPVVRRAPRPVTYRRRRPRVRRVTRVVRHVDTWSVFKVALVFNAVLYLVCLTAGVLLWNVAHTTGTVDNVEQFFEQFGWETFEFRGGELYHNLWIAGLFVAIGLTGFAVLLATVFNLITDLVGGIRVSVLEEEVVARSLTRASDLEPEPATVAPDGEHPTVA